MVNSTEQAQQHVMTSATRQPTLEGPAGNTRTRSDDTAGERQAAAITIAAAIVTGTVRGQLCVMARTDDVRAAARATEDSGDVRNATVINPDQPTWRQQPVWCFRATCGDVTTCNVRPDYCADIYHHRQASLTTGQMNFDPLLKLLSPTTEL